MRPMLMLGLVFFQIGCLSQPKAPHASYAVGLTPTCPPVKDEGWYQLRSSGNVVAQQHVEKGQQVGFVEESPGQVVAVAPGLRIPLEATAYEWVSNEVDRPSWILRREQEAFRGVQFIGESVLALSVVTGYAIVMVALECAKGSAPLGAR